MSVGGPSPDMEGQNPIREALAETGPHRPARGEDYKPAASTIVPASNPVREIMTGAMDRVELLEQAIRSHRSLCQRYGTRQHDAALHAVLK